MTYFDISSNTGGCMIGLITGASRGLGFEMVRIGLERGYDMVACWLGPPEDPSGLLELQKIRYQGSNKGSRYCNVPKNH